MMMQCGTVSIWRGKREICTPAAIIVIAEVCSCTQESAKTRTRTMQEPSLVLLGALTVCNVCHTPQYKVLNRITDDSWSWIYRPALRGYGLALQCVHSYCSYAEQCEHSRYHSYHRINHKTRLKPSIWLDRLWSMCYIVYTVYSQWSCL